MKPFYHTLISDPVEAKLNPVNEGDFWIAIDGPYIRINEEWVISEDWNAENIWLLCQSKSSVSVNYH